MFSTTKKSGCSRNLTASSGVIQSPNYPSSYSNVEHCVWIIRALPGRRIQLTFQSFSLQSSVFCRSDSLMVRNGGTPSSSLLARLCGTRTVSPITSTGNLMYIEFQSDATITGRGFRLTWSSARRKELL
ncbi:Tolloid-like protein 1 [Elysia marginata]|uniref:Tolloid-like protein 1 n=1 Tax=Elysia marginata TaxID=1093978 RepID=A0AAV4HXH6_9GAST|nr:Tolloid-like protein 1 [Elysia marginata]